MISQFRTSSFFSSPAKNPTTLPYIHETSSEAASILSRPFIPASWSALSAASTSLSGVSAKGQEKAGPVWITICAVFKRRIFCARQFCLPGAYNNNNIPPDLPPLPPALPSMPGRAHVRLQALTSAISLFTIRTRPFSHTCRCILIFV